MTRLRNNNAATPQRDCTPAVAPIQPIQRQLFLNQVGVTEVQQHHSRPGAL